MKESIYSLAAEMLEHPELVPTPHTTAGFSCLAVECANKYIKGVYNTGTPERLAYEELFRPEKPEYPTAWGCDWHELNDPLDAQDKCRVLALLFMHWITEEGEVL